MITHHEELIGQLDSAISLASQHRKTLEFIVTSVTSDFPGAMQYLYVKSRSTETSIYLRLKGYPDHCVYLRHLIFPGN